MIGKWDFAPMVGRLTSWRNPFRVVSRKQLYESRIFGHPEETRGYPDVSEGRFNFRAFDADHDRTIWANELADLLCWPSATMARVPATQRENDVPAGHFVRRGAISFRSSSSFPTREASSLMKARDALLGLWYVAQQAQ
jgi:hypothetical protein